MWLSLVERFVRDEEAVGSNPVTPISFLEVRVYQVHLFSISARQQGDQGQGISFLRWQMLCRHLSVVHFCGIVNGKDGIRKDKGHE